MAGPLVVLGHGLLEVLLLILIVLGLANVMKTPGMIGAISLAGGAVLLWLSFGMLRDAKKAKLDLTARDGLSVSPVAAGILTSISNPYWIIWWATIGLGYVVSAMELGVAGVLSFFAGHILADLLWFSGVSFLVARGKRYVSDRFYRGVIRGCALVLIFFAVYFGILGIRYIR